MSFGLAPVESLARQNAALDRALDKLIGPEPRFGVLRAVQVRMPAPAIPPPDFFETVVVGVEDRETRDFFPIGDIVTALFAAVGLEAA